MKKTIWIGLTIGGGITILFLARGITALVTAGQESTGASNNSLDLPLPLLEAAVKNVSDKQRQEELAPEGGLTAKEAGRQYALDAARDTYQAEAADLVCARKAYFLSQAAEWTQQTGGSTETWLLDKLGSVQAKAKESAITHTAYSGAPNHQAKARPLALDSLALLEALDTLYSGQAIATCTSAPMPAIAKTGEFLYAAKEYQQWLSQELAPRQVTPQEEVAANDN